MTNITLISLYLNLKCKFFELIMHKLFYNFKGVNSSYKYFAIKIKLLFYNSINWKEKYSL